MAFFETYPLTTSQQEIWFDQLLHPDVPLYNVAKAVQLEGTIDRVLFAQALEHVVARNDALRIVLVAGDELPTQRILDHLPLSIEYHDFSEHEDAEEQAQEWMRRETARPFQLHDHELFTFALLKVGEERSYWLAKYHHLITDGWAATLIVERVAATYNALCDGLPLPTDCWPSYLDFVRDDQAYMASERCQRDIAYWQAVYTTLPEPLFQNRHDMAPEEAARSHQSQRNLNRETCAPLRDFATEHRTTLNQIFLGTLYCYFVRIGQRDDLAIGLSSANRLTSAFRQTIGLFTNTIAPWYRFGTELTFLDLLRALQTEAERGAPHRRLPMSVLRRNTTLVQTQRAQPFDVAVSYMSGASETPFGKTPATFQSIFTGYLPRGLTIYIEDQRAKGSVRLLFDGSATLFTPQDLERLGERLELLLGQVVRNPTTPIAQLPIIPQAEQQKILVEWNDTAADYPQDKCVHQLFEDQVAKAPGAIAVETGHTRLTYSALDTQANRLAHHLRNLGVGPEMRVGLCVERSVDMLVGLLGILKAGAAYVPLDPSYPAERLCYMLADAGISILVTQSYLEARMPTFDATVVCLDATGTPWKDLPTTSPDSGVTAGNALYVIYTSGSTGRPKGVVVEHHSVVSLLRGLLAQQHRYAAPCKVLHRASLAFDVSVLELLGPLLAGGCVVMAPVDAGSAPAALASLIRRCCVTYADFPPALLAYLLEEPDFVHAESLRVVTVGGEALDSALAVRFTKECRAELWNDYGPTEATVEATAWPVARYRETKSVRIGRPLPGYRVYVVGRYGDLNPIGIPGELCIGGIGVTRGYLAKPGSSAARFVPDPFSNVPGARMYRTADLCRWTEDGDLEFLGRIDHQVKIRGFRIELGEIEAALSSHSSVRTCVVLAREDVPGDKRLAAYVVPNDDECSVSVLREHVGKTLPDYMVPSAFVVLDALPLTPNSKVDRKALPAPSTTIRTDVYVAPRTFVEKALADVWAHVLGLERVGIFDNFFELGGDSILTIQIIAKSQRAGFRFSMQQLFQHQTIADLATVAIPVVHAHMQQSPVSGPVVLTPIQQWFFEQAMAEPHHFNQAMLFVVRERVELPALRQAVAQLVDHHDALRLRFVHEGAKVRQVNLERDDTVRVELVDLSAIPAAEQAAAIEAKSADVQRGMSLETGPLMRTVLMDLGPDRPSRLLLVIHHLAVDGVSWRILIEDLETAYHQACRGETLRLPPKTTSFQRWAQHLATYAQSDNVLGELSYWRSLPSATPIPIDLEDGENTVASAKTLKVSLGIEETAALLREVPEILQTQINDVLLFALAEALVPWLGTHRLCIHLEGHGRGEIAPGIDVSRTVGWFTTMFPVVFDLPQAPLVQAIGAVRDQLRRIPHSGLGYGLLRYMQDDAAIAMALSAAPQAHVMFNYLWQLDSIAASSLFEFAPESTGPDQSPQAVRSHQIEINGHVLGGRLEFGWTYSANLHTRETIESLAQRFFDSLRVMVAYGRSMKRGEIQSAPDGAGCCLVPLVEGSQPGAIVLFAAVGGHLSSHMIRLARGMGGGRPVLGMTTPPHVGSGTMPKTLEALGGRYARDILARIPCSGPLSFVGYCYGGYSAMETTIHLQRFGRAVDKVVMIEARAPWLSDESATDFDRTTTLVNVASLWGLTLDRAHFVGLSEDEALRKIMAHLSAANLDSTGADRTLRAILDTQQAHREMLGDWQPYEPKAPVYLLRASEQSADVPLDYGWKARIALAGVEEVPGDHFGIVRGKNLEVTARTVIQILTRRGT